VVSLRSLITVLWPADVMVMQSVHVMAPCCAACYGAVILPCGIGVWGVLLKKQGSVLRAGWPAAAEPDFIMQRAAQCIEGESWSGHFFA
jgi:hypothetical protein